jgi:hypothetical protein
MVQPAENILSGHRQSTHADGCLARPRSHTRIRDSGSQARRWLSLIVRAVGDGEGILPDRISCGAINRSREIPSSH